MKAVVDRIVRLLRWTMAPSAAALMLCGCDSAPPPPPPPAPTIVELSLAAAADSNPDKSGRASPVVVRIYQLAVPTSLMKADFLAIYDKDAGTLGADLVSCLEFSMAPGEQKQSRLDIKPGVQGIAVVALFRDFTRSNWRSYAVVPANQTSHLSAMVTAHDVSLSTEH